MAALPLLVWQRLSGNAVLCHTPAYPYGYVWYHACAVKRMMRPRRLDGLPWRPYTFRRDYALMKEVDGPRPV